MKRRYCYLVYCNPEPIVYAVFSNYKRAFAYAEFLIEYRKEAAEREGYEFGFYHYQINNHRANPDCPNYVCFTCCLSVKDKNGERVKQSIAEDGCFIKIERRPLLSQ